MHFASDALVGVESSIIFRRGLDTVYGESQPSCRTPGISGQANEVIAVLRQVSHELDAEIAAVRCGLQKNFAVRANVPGSFSHMSGGGCVFRAENNRIHRRDGRRRINGGPEPLDFLFSEIIVILGKQLSLRIANGQIGKESPGHVPRVSGFLPVQHPNRRVRG